MRLDKLTNPAGTKNRKRVGRGDSSGLGRTCGRGEKGQKSRSGSTIRPHFEGGQMPLFRRLPHIQGFKARNHKLWTLVSIAQLEDLFEAGETVTLDAFEAKGAFTKLEYGVKILSDGEITKALTVQANAFSKTAKAKIEAAGGTCEVI